MKMPWTANKYIQYVQTKRYLEDLKKTVEELKSEYCRKCSDLCHKCHVAALLNLKG